MLIAAALCPAPPLLIPELTGAAEVAADLRTACLAVVTELMASEPDVIAVVGAGAQTRTWEPGSHIDLAAFAPGPAGAASGTTGLPATVGVGGWLLDQAGYAGERLLQSVGEDEPAGSCAGIGAKLAGARERVGLLVLADGSTRRGLKAPGYLDERSAAFDAGIEQAVRDGDLRALLDVDQELARELMATGRAAWQVLAGGAEGCQVSAEIKYSGDPFGVAYLVASVRVRE